MYVINMQYQYLIFTLPEHLSSPSVLSGVRVTLSLDLYVCFVDRLSFCTCFAIVLSVLLRYTISDYSFGIFKLFFWRFAYLFKHLNIKQVLTLSLGLETDIFIANSPTTVLLTVNDKLVTVSIHFYIKMLKSVWKTNCVLFYVKTKPLKIKWTVNFKELVKVTVLIANVYLSTCGSLSSEQ
jgi:hypothetical protein